MIAISPHFSSQYKVGGAILKGVNEQSRMWEIRVSSGLAFKSTPPMRLRFIPQRKKPAWQAQVFFFG